MNRSKSKDKNKSNALFILLCIIGLLIISEAAEFIVAYGIVTFICWLIGLKFSWKPVFCLWLVMTVIFTRVNMTLEG